MISNMGMVKYSCQQERFMRDNGIKMLDMGLESLICAVVMSIQDSSRMASQMDMVRWSLTKLVMFMKANGRMERLLGKEYTC